MTGRGHLLQHSKYITVQYTVYCVSCQNICNSVVSSSMHVLTVENNRTHICL